MTTAPVLVDQNDGVATVTLNRPDAMNSLDVATKEALLDAVTSVGEDPAVHLARSNACEQQAFRYADNAYGFQFHLEMDERLVERWLANPAYRDELANSGLPHDGHADLEQAIRAQTRQHIAAMQQQADAVFNNFLDLVGRPQRRYTLPSREWA